MENFIQLQKSNVLKFGIKTADGEDTGEYLEFDIEDIELGLRLKNAQVEHHNNQNNLKAKFIIIDKQQDKKGKYFLSKNQEEKIKALVDFYKKDAEILDGILGKGGTEKMLNGRKHYYTMFEDIVESLKPILPKLQQSTEDVMNKIVKKYDTKKDDVME